MNSLFIDSVSGKINFKRNWIQFRGKWVSNETSFGVGIVFSRKLRCLRVHEVETSFGIGIVLRKHRPNELETFNNNLKTIWLYFFIFIAFRWNIIYLLRFILYVLNKCQCIFLRPLQAISFDYIRCSSADFPLVIFYF